MLATKVYIIQTNKPYQKKQNYSNLNYLYYVMLARLNIIIIKK